MQMTLLSLKMPPQILDSTGIEYPIELTAPQKGRRRALVVPREHGAWGMLLIPLLTGVVVGLRAGGRVTPVLLLTTLVLALFWLKTPLESLLGTGAVEVQTIDESRLVRRFAVPLITLAAFVGIALFWQGKNRDLLRLGMIAGTAFAGHLLLKKMGRATRVAAEVVGAMALTSTAPAAYCAATARLDATAWALWLLNWLFAANQIHFVWLAIRGARCAGSTEKFLVGFTFLAGQVLLGAILLVACRLAWLPGLTAAAFLPLLLRGFAWFGKRSQPIRIRRLGWTELAHAVAFGVLLAASLAQV
jgi:YwiC-like protein